MFNSRDWAWRLPSTGWPCPSADSISIGTAVIIAVGMLLALLYAFRNAPDFGIDSDRLVDVVAIGTVMAIVCARIYYVAMAPFQYHSLWEMVDIRLGGIAIYGAVIGAFVFGGSGRQVAQGAAAAAVRSGWRWPSSSARASAAGATL